MQNVFTENLSKIYQTYSKPAMELAQLNISMLSNLAKNTVSFDELAQAKKPEDIIAAQIRLTNAAYVEGIRYTQKAVEIGLAAVSDAGKMWNETINKTTSKVSDFAKSSNLKASD